MIINPLTAIENGWVSGINDQEKQVQPNAIDFTLDRLFGISALPFFISKDDKVTRNGGELTPSQHFIRRPSKDNPTHVDIQEITAWELYIQTSYDGTSNMYVNLPKDIAVLPIFTRSTLNRNGVFLTSGLYDSGYAGHIGFVIHNMVRGSVYIEPGTPVGQIMFVHAESAKMYAGQWNHEQGSHYSEK